MSQDNKNGQDIDWSVQDATNIRVEGTVFNPVVEQLNLQEGITTSLQKEWNIEK